MVFVTWVLIPLAVVLAAGWLALDGLQEQLDGIEDILLELIDGVEVEELAGEMAARDRLDAGLYDWQDDFGAVAR